MNQTDYDTLIDFNRRTAEGKKTVSRNERARLKQVLKNEMSAPDFKRAYEEDHDRLEMVYMNYARIICYEKLMGYKQMDAKLALIIEKDAADRAVESMYNKYLEKFDPEKGAAFPSYFHTAVSKYAFNECLREHARTGLCDETSQAGLGQICDESPEEAQRTSFNNRVITAICRIVSEMSPLQKRILEARCGGCIPSADAVARVESDLVESKSGSSYGWSVRLSQELANEGKTVSPAALRQRLSQDILPEIKALLPRQMGLSRTEIRDNMHCFIPGEDEACRLLDQLDLNSLSDDDVAWLVSHLFTK